MITDLIRKWEGSVVINGTEYTETAQIAPDLDLNGRVSILFKPNTEMADLGKSESQKAITETVSVYDIQDNKQYRIFVKGYMIKSATPDFDFMAKWNDNNPMPLRVMVGEKIKETRGMIYMKLHGDILEQCTPTCMKCGKPIPNPVSQFFGMGPECGGHNYTNPFSSDEELEKAVEQYRTKLRNMTWEGWIIKSAIEKVEEVK